MCRQPTAGLRHELHGVRRLGDGEINVLEAVEARQLHRFQGPRREVLHEWPGEGNEVAGGGITLGDLPDPDPEAKAPVQRVLLDEAPSRQGPEQFMGRGVRQRQVSSNGRERRFPVRGQVLQDGEHAFC